MYVMQNRCHLAHVICCNETGSVPSEEVCCCTGFPNGNACFKHGMQRICVAAVMQAAAPFEEVIDVIILQYVAIIAEHLHKV